MKIDDNIKKCVAFLQFKKADGSFNFAGTCFFAGHLDQESGLIHGSVITAKHVIENIKKHGLDEVYIKINIKDGTSECLQTKVVGWVYHPDVNVDIAIQGFSMLPNYDHVFYPLTSFLTDELIKSNEIGCGDEVFITGLFKHHVGGIRNSPIVRIGNIALMPSEIINVSGFSMDAYLIESRSIGGLSGSPVFVNLGTTRKLENQVRFSVGGHIPPLFGIVCGHFDSEKGDIDSLLDKSSNEEKINVGIAIITPVSKLSYFFESLLNKQSNKAISNS